MYVILDIIVNHCPNVLVYEDGGAGCTGEVFETKGFFDAERQQNFLPVAKANENQYQSAFLDAPIWSVEPQDEVNFVQKGHIVNRGATLEYQ